MHSDTDTDQKHHEPLHFRTHLDQPRNCLFCLSRISACALLNLCWSIREWVLAARGRRWTWRLWRATRRRASRRAPSPKTVGGQAAVLINVLRAIKRGDLSPRYVGGSPRRLTPELLDEIREFIEEEHGRISVKLRCLRLYPLVIRTVPHLQDRHIRDRRKFAEEMLARLALGSGRHVIRSQFSHVLSGRSGAT